MNWFETWTRSLNDSFYNVTSTVGSFLPKILSALIIFLIGLFLANLFKGLVNTILKRIRIDRLIEGKTTKKYLADAGVTMSLSDFISILVYWFVIIVFLIPVADTLGLPQIANYIGLIAFYIPNVIIASVILVVGITLGDLVGNIVTGAMRRSEIGVIAGSVSRWSIIIFSILLALTQLGVNSSLIQILFSGIVIAIALATGLAFGLGGVDAAKKLIGRLNNPQNLPKKST